MAIFVEITENEYVKERHPLSKAITWSILRAICDVSKCYLLIRSRMRAFDLYQIGDLEWPWTVWRPPTRAISAVAELLVKRHTFAAVPVPTAYRSIERIRPSAANDDRVDVFKEGIFTFRWDRCALIGRRHRRRHNNDTVNDVSPFRPARRFVRVLLPKLTVRYVRVPADCDRDALRIENGVRTSSGILSVPAFEQSMCNRCWLSDQRTVL